MKICLGTVQLGLDYGINNKTGKPSKSQSLAILEYAFENGINCFDTAAAYGNAEEILGEFIKINGLSNKDIKVISKLKPNLIDNSAKNASMIVEEEIEKSLKKLNLNRLDGFLLHTPANIYSSYIVEGLKDARKKNLTSNIGVSVYEVEDAVYTAKLKDINYIQVSYNVLDQRLDQTDFLDLTKNDNHTIFARSPFLQGLLLMQESEIPVHLDKSKEYIRKFSKVLSKYNYSKIEACLLFSLMKNKNNFIVFGVESLSQLKENLSIIKKFENNEDFLNDIQSIFNNVDEGVVIPSLWSKN